jgi:hypothetical protein
MFISTPFPDQREFFNWNSNFINYDEYIIAHLYSRILQRGKSPEEKEDELQGNKS